MATPRRDPHRRDPPMSDEEIFEMLGEQPNVLDTFLGVPQRIPPPAPSSQASGLTRSRAVRQVGQTQSRAARGPMTPSERTRMEGALRNQTPLTPTKDEIIATQTRALADKARENAELKQQIAALTKANASLHSFIATVDFAPATVVTRAVPSAEPSPRTLPTAVSAEPSPRGSFFTRVAQVLRGGNSVSVPETARAATVTTLRTTPPTPQPPENVYAAWEEISPVQAVAPARPPPPAIRQRAGTVARTEPVYAVARRGLPSRPRVRFQTPDDSDEHDVDGTIA